MESRTTSSGSCIGALRIFADAKGDITQPVNVTGNTIKDTSYQTVLLGHAHQISGPTLDHDTITGPGTSGFDIDDVPGSMTVSNTSASGTASSALHNPGGCTMNRGPGTSGFRPPSLPRAASPSGTPDCAPQAQPGVPEVGEVGTVPGPPGTAGRRRGGPPDSRGLPTRHTWSITQRDAVPMVGWKLTWDPTTPLPFR
ncbi:hypothetical protein SAMN05216223_1086 [Actinacidiphila yanglinensis]|uniref:Uncharacterized protein n=1 Tax=Actinacidiphila yanglinensis TaxID=310779 RepID=A0A1H6C3V3_9ACTN|nr:hypothetical protein [Actinacidiphila yanglinensis]SEG67644.1 hypothetical protein SAMN05216223_1086 [Actinacidiphila yanglinensis]